MRRSSDPLVRRVLKACRTQGWTVVETKSGWILRSPHSGTQVSMHQTSSDYRAARNLLTQLRNEGLDI